MSEGAGRPFPAPDPDLERHGLGEADQANAAADGREARFVSWRDLERVADEAADIDAVVRSELEALGKRRVVDEETVAGWARPPRRRRLPAGAFLAVLVGAAITAALLIVWNGGEQPDERATSPIARTSSAVPTTQPPSNSPPAIPPKAIVARLSFSAPCWVEAVADERTVFVGTITDGSRTIRAKRTLLLTLGNAGGVDLVVNGRTESTGAAGEVVQLSFALEGGRVAQLTS